MTAAKKYDVEGPIGLQLTKKQHTKMLKEVDVAMQKLFIRKSVLQIPLPLIISSKRFRLQQISRS